ncbi:hypothetical protein KUCAC02_025054 [Chaenocephalus aceratus]|nr:hypothetical protein KUCAC02_025054 [Chaenocephalus aceratus]
MTRTTSLSPVLRCGSVPLRGCMCACLLDEASAPHESLPSQRERPVSDYKNATMPLTPSHSSSEAAELHEQAMETRGNQSVLEAFSRSLKPRFVPRVI